MNKLRLMIMGCVMAFISGQSVMSQNTAITFQNGVNGYQGCEDTYVDVINGNSNFGTLDKLNCENYSVTTGSG